MTQPPAPPKTRVIPTLCAIFLAAWLLSHLPNPGLIGLACGALVTALGGVGLVRVAHRRRR